MYFTLRRIACKMVKSLLAAALFSVTWEAAGRSPVRIPLVPMPASWQPDSLFVPDPVSDERWWKEFNDPLLDSLVRQAVSRNFDLLAAADRIRMAQANYIIEQGSFYPSVGLNLGWTDTRSSERTTKQVIPGMENTEKYFSAGLSTSWEIDVFGSIRERVRSQRELYKVSQEEYNGVLVSLRAQVASVYAALRTLQQQYRVARQNLASQAEILRITEVRYNVGLASQLDVAQAKSVYYDTKASIPDIETSIARNINSMAVLIGVYPSDIRSMLTPVRPLPDYVRLVQVGIPANLLRQRPDIRSAERTVAADAASLGATKADYLPKFYLKGSIGFAARRLDDLFNHRSFTYEIAPSMNWTLFQGRELVQANKLAQAQLDESIRQYNQTVLTAVQEVDIAMTTYANTLRQIMELREVVYQGKETLRLSLDLYKRGLSTFQSVLDAQRSLLSYENALVSAEGSALSSLIQLYRALGGGWDPTMMNE